MWMRTLCKALKVVESSAYLVDNLCSQRWRWQRSRSCRHCLRPRRIAASGRAGCLAVSLRGWTNSWGLSKCSRHDDKRRHRRLLMTHATHETRFLSLSLSLFLTLSKCLLHWHSREPTGSAHFQIINIKFVTCEPIGPTQSNKASRRSLNPSPKCKWMMRWNRRKL